MKFSILLLFILCLTVYSSKILERAHWASTLRHTKSDSHRLKALDNSKQLDVKIQGKGYFQYIILETERLANAANCSESDTVVVGKYLDPTGSGNSKLYPANSDIPSLCSIRDSHHNGGPARYVASTGVTLGSALTAVSGVYEAGFQWSASAIQVNAERQSSITTTQSADPPSAAVGSYSVEYYNGDRSVDASDLAANWVDPNVYSLKIDTSTGSMNVYTYGAGTCGSVVAGFCGYTFSPYTMNACTSDSDCSGSMSETGLQWTITGYGHTVLRGTVEETTTNSVTTTRLIVKDGELRSVSLGSVTTTEIVAYTFTGAASSIGAGSVLGVELKTETPCDDFYLDGTDTEKSTKCATVANTKASLALGNQLIYQTRKESLDDGTTIRYYCEVIETTTPHVESSETDANLYRCNNVQGTHIDSYETRHDTRLIYNRYGRFHVNRYGFLVDSNGLLLIGENHLGTKTAIHIPSRYDDIIIMRNGKVYASYDYSASSVFCGIINLVRFANDQGLELYNDAPITTNCKSENKIGFALGTWCADTDLDGLDVWYYTESSVSGTPIEAAPMSLGFGTLRQYTLATKASDLYIGGVVPDV